VLLSKVNSLLSSRGTFSFQLNSSKIDPNKLRSSVLHPSCGGLVIFEGIVRDFNEGKVVTALEYEAYPELVDTESKKIFSEIQSQFQCRSVVVEHRIGKLDVGDIAVWIGVSSVHRGAAFKACEYMIDELKIRLPIWKKEHYSDHFSSWVNCQTCGNYKSKVHTPLFEPCKTT
jgi:molybdopterin synthase catalytic subunit